MTRFMWCSTSRTVSSKSSRSRRMKSPRSATSSWFSPPAGSSSRSRRGFATSARASSTRFCDPVRQRRRREARALASPTTSSTSSASSSLTLPATRVRAHEHVLEHGHRPEELDVLERARDPLAARSGAPARRRSDSPSKLDLARVRLVEPRDDVERRRLAGAVRADQARDVPCSHVERHAVESDDASEAERDVPDGEQSHLARNPKRPAWTAAISGESCPVPSPCRVGVASAAQGRTDLPSTSAEGRNRKVRCTIESRCDGGSSVVSSEEVGDSAPPPVASAAARWPVWTIPSNYI